MKPRPSEYPIIALEPSLSSSGGRRPGSAAWRRRRPLLFLVGGAVILLALGWCSPVNVPSRDWAVAADGVQRALNRWADSATRWSFSTVHPPDASLQQLDLAVEESELGLGSPISVEDAVLSGQDAPLEDEASVQIEVDDEAVEDVRELLSALTSASEATASSAMPLSSTSTPTPSATPTSTIAASTAPALALPTPLAGGPLLDMQPRSRSPPRPDANQRYLAYLPHSGFANQRIELVNAVVLASMLNRTLLLPPARLGFASDWAPTARAQREQTAEQKSELRHCVRWLPELETLKRGQAFAGPAECKRFASYTFMSWDWRASDPGHQDDADLPKSSISIACAGP